MIERELVLSSVRQILGGLKATLDETAEYLVLRLPAAPDSHFRFLIYIYADGEPQLAAESLPSRASGENSTKLWTMAFERADFKTTQAMQEVFLRTLRTVLKHRTRIVRGGTGLTRSSKCDYWNGDHWVHLGGMSYLTGAAPEGWDRRPAEETLVAERLLGESPEEDFRQ